MIAPLFRVFGHRGACGYVPENTLASLKKALELGAPWVEFDVRVVGDTPILFHDRDLERRAQRPGQVETQNVNDLRKLDVGNGERIPLLREALEFLQARCGINVELKGRGPVEPVAAELIKALADGWPPEQLIVSSFDHHKLRTIASLIPSVPIAVLSYGDPLYLLETARALSAQAVVMHHDGVSRERIDQLHAEGLEVYVYTVNSESDMQLFKDMGVDGIFSDYPDRALKYV